jgi:hypothetical protein
MRRAGLALVAAGALVAGCGGTVHDGDRMVRTGTLPARSGPGGKLIGQPDPLTLAALARYPAGSPQAAVMRVLFYAQWGGMGSVVDAYTPTARRALGEALIARAYTYARAGIATDLPRVTAVRRGGAVAVVSVSLASPVHPPLLSSWVLRLGPDGWRIAYDSLLSSSVVAVLTADPRGGPFAARLAHAHGLVQRFSTSAGLTGAVPAAPSARTRR